MPPVVRPEDLRTEFQGPRFDLAPSPSLPSTMASAMRREFLGGNLQTLLPRLAADREARDRAVPEANFFSEAPGTVFEGREDRLVDVKTRRQFDALRRQIEGEERDDRVLERAGLVGTVSQIAAGVASPENLIPVVGAVRRVRTAGQLIGRGALAGGGGAALSEVLLHQTQELRTAEESATGIVASTLFGAGLGTVAAGLTRSSRAAREAHTRIAAGHYDQSPGFTPEGDLVLSPDQVELAPPVQRAGTSPTVERLRKARAEELESPEAVVESYRAGVEAATAEASRVAAQALSEVPAEQLATFPRFAAGFGMLDISDLQRRLQGMEAEEIARALPEIEASLGAVDARARGALEATRDVLATRLLALQEPASTIREAGAQLSAAMGAVRSPEARAALGQALSDLRTRATEITRQITTQLSAVDSELAEAEGRARRAGVARRSAKRRLASAERDRARAIGESDAAAETNEGAYFDALAARDAAEARTDIERRRLDLLRLERELLDRRLRHARVPEGESVPRGTPEPEARAPRPQPPPEGTESLRGDDPSLADVWGDNRRWMGLVVRYRGREATVQSFKRRVGAVDLAFKGGGAQPSATLRQLEVPVTNDVVANVRRLDGLGLTPREGVRVPRGTPEAAPRAPLAEIRQRMQAIRREQEQLGQRRDAGAGARLEALGRELDELEIRLDKALAGEDAAEITPADRRGRLLDTEAERLAGPVQGRDATLRAAADRVVASLERLETGRAAEGQPSALPASPEELELVARQLGINSDSLIALYQSDHALADFRAPRAADPPPPDGPGGPQPPASPVPPSPDAVRPVLDRILPIFGLPRELTRRLLRWSPVMRLSQSLHPEARWLVQHLVETNLAWEKSLFGVANPQAVSRNVITRWRSRQIRLDRDLSRLYVKAVQRTRGEDGDVPQGILRQRLVALREGVAGARGADAFTRRDFSIRVTRAHRNGGRDVVPDGASRMSEVEEAARLVQQLMDDAGEEMIRIRLLPESVRDRLGKGYLSRLWNRDALRERAEEWKGLVANRLVADEGLDAEEAASIADHMHLHALGESDGRLDYAPTGPRRTRVTERRVVPGEDKEWGELGFLEEDLDLVMAHWFRTVPPDIELARLDFEDASRIVDDEGTPLTETAGWRPDPQLRRVLANVQEAMTARAASETDPRAQERLLSELGSNMRDLEALVELIRGTYGRPRGGNTAWGRAGRLFGSERLRDVGFALRHYNYSTDAGGFGLGSIPDAGRAFHAFGMARTFRTGLRPLFQQLDAVKGNMREVQNFGTGADLVTNTTVIERHDLGDDFGRGNAFRRGLQAVTDAYSIATGLSGWNQMMKQWVGSSVGQNVLDWSQMVATGKRWDGATASAKELSEARTQLARLAIGDDLPERIWAQVQDRWDPDADVIPFHTEEWGDAEARDAFGFALSSAVDSVINTPKIGQQPLGMSTDLGKIVFQYKSFAFASTMQTTMPMLQEPGRAWLGGAIMMTSLAMLSIKLKALAGDWDVPEFDSPEGAAWWFRNGVDRSGLPGAGSTINDLISAATRGEVEAGRILAMGYGQEGGWKPRGFLKELIGPSGGTIDDVEGFLSGAARGATGEGLPDRTFSASRRLTPFNNHFLLNRTVYRPLFDGLRALGQ